MVFVLGLLSLIDVSCAAADVLAPATLCGRIVNLDGETVCGRVSMSFRPTGETHTASADADGRFRLCVEPQEAAGMYGSLESGGLIVEGVGLAPVVVSLPVLPSGAEIDIGDIHAPTGTRLAGQVTDAVGNPMVCAKVTLSPFTMVLGHTMGGLLPDCTLATDAQGRFESRPLPCCFVEMDVHADGFQIGAVVQQLDGRDRLIEVQSIRMQREIPVRGQVHDAKGQPIRDARIFWLPGGECRTDENGHFRLTGFGPDDNNIQVITSAEGYRPHSEVYQPESLITIQLDAVHCFTGRVIDAQSRQPITLQHVVLCNYSLDVKGKPRLDGCRSARLQRSDNGHFSIEHFGAARYHVLFRAEGYHDGELFLDPLDTDRDHDLGTVELRPDDTTGEDHIVSQRLYGGILNGGRPIAGVTVSLWRPGSRMTDTAYYHYGRHVPAPPSFLHMTVSGDDGGFEFSVPHQGEWFLRADAAGAAPTVVGPISVGRGKAVCQDVELAEGGSLVGRMQRSEHVAPGVLWAIAFDGKAIVEVAQVGPDGTFKFGRLPTGTYGVKVGHPGMKTLAESQSEADSVRADPWSRAEKATVVAGETTTVEVGAE